ncbi:hypothetical protein [Anaeromicropila populeti]|uniref:Uncharacterized protein n=1 Tax=Anaeromicropila populeti TaxID=37658 RepID=A0A1I6JNL6_9FIRM|nr:hypothetical protein [Anaeromicropila populeti]SFR80130.1 hypothetical protein SAMN05661086_01762 [Anaeromicropila populeti]
MQQEKWMEDPVFQKMDPRKKKILMDISKQSKGKSMQQALPLILSAQTQLKSQNLSFTPKERDTLFTILTHDMSQEELAKFEVLKKMMKI